jgi:hypothetical protein
MVTGLISNVQTSMVRPIGCRNVDLDIILFGFPALRATFPIRYFGSPLLVHHPKNVDFQFTIDKLESKLPIG